MDRNLIYTKKNGKDNYMKMVEVKKIVGQSKLKFWTFYWGHGEHEWPLIHTEKIKAKGVGGG